MYTCTTMQVTKQALPPRSPRHAARVRRPIDSALSADLFRALGDPTRLTLLACLAKCARPCSVTEVADCCSVDLSVVSRHLAILARAGVLASERRAKTVHYTVRYTDLAASLRAMADAVDACIAHAPTCCDAGGCCAPATPRKRTKGANA